LEKAYDTTWKYGILKDLYDAGLRGRIPLFISGFLFVRKFQVRVGGTYSKACEQEMGVPQGSILSVTLFCLKINSIVKALCPGVDCSLHVDDFLIYYRSKHIQDYCKLYTDGSMSGDQVGSAAICGTTTKTV